MGKSSKIYLRAVYLRDLLVAHVTGRRVNEADYHKLRDYFMGLPETSKRVPAVVAEHADLPSLWHSMRYNYGSQEDRKSYIVDQFQAFLDPLVSEKREANAARGAGYPLIDEKKLQSVWAHSAELLVKNSDVAIEQMKSLIENLCHQLLKNLKIIPNPHQHNLAAMVMLTEQSLLLSADKQYYLVIKKLISGCRETLSAIDNFTIDQADLSGKSHGSDRATGLVLISLYGSLACMLLASWRVREMLQEGSIQR
ncbi:hypothetical protein [Neptunomonas antarctica]|uniref:Abortive infection C-terminus n=1 Tax=Neptunomonas antarctica TaxID=619304 RepID=A0A1N7KE93_9GAMM|nr:hypothetical protein [Neptunomonas antarctica]SIS59897.1 hypothetical protein SAMN05421760_102371 [Neptunomonas antarctica]